MVYKLSVFLRFFANPDVSKREFDTLKGSCELFTRNFSEIIEELLTNLWKLRENPKLIEKKLSLRVAASLASAHYLAGGLR